MEHDSVSVANELVSRAHAAGKEITNMQVIKMTYLCHAWMLGLYHRPLLSEPIEAWQYGPVIGKVYDAFRRYGSGHIRHLAWVEEEEYDEQESDLIDQVYRIYGDHTGQELSSMTHAPGTPWRQMWDEEGKYGIIPDPLIEDYYAAKKAASV